MVTVASVALPVSGAVFSRSTSNPVSTLAASTFASAYVATVVADSPWLYYRLDETCGTIAYDSSGSGRGGVHRPGVTLNAAGAIARDNDGSVSFNGSSGVVTNATSVTNPGSFTVEAWFRTSTTSGGKIIGFEDSAAAANGTNFDRMVYMTNTGQLVFAVYPGSYVSIASSASYNDGQWHHVVATQGSAGMVLYVDGSSVGTNPATTGQNFTGYWRVGGGNLVSWPSAPTSYYFNGTIDEAAVYTTALSAARVAAHWTAGRPYVSIVKAGNPYLYFRFSEASGTTAADSSGNTNSGTYYGGGVTHTAAGTGVIPADPDRAVTLSGATGTAVVSGSAVTFATSTPFSVEAWFRTSTTTGGKIIGFEDGSTGAVGVNADRHVYMTNAGQLVFGVAPGGVISAVTSSASYNDGQWHHVVATQGSGGMVLYVDGASVGTNVTSSAQLFTGYWRIGGGKLVTWPAQPTSDYFAGTVDEAAVHTSALTATQVAARYAQARAYRAVVTADGPYLYHRLGDLACVSTVADSSGSARSANVYGGVTGTTGVVTNDSDQAAAFNGASGSVVVNTASMTNPSTYSLEAWFRTSTSSGGKIIGFENSSNATAGTSYDRLVYMTDLGRLMFGVYTGSNVTVTSTATYNDGAWHHVVATQGSGGMALYVDGTSVATNGTTLAENFTGYWRMGGGAVGGWPSAPSSNYFNGAIDEVAVYTTALTTAQVAAHYRAR